MQEQLYILGTGNAMVTHCYNTCFALRREEEYFLVDAGGGSQILAILEQMQITVENIHHIFVTHEHCDHIVGMIWMVRKIATMMRQGKYTGELHIYCHAGLVDTIQTLCKLTLQKKFTDLFGQRILFHPLEDGDHANILGWDVTFFDIHSTKAKQFGFTIHLCNGKKLTCIGDEPYHESTAPYVQGSDWLLCEAFCLYADREIFKPYEKHHSTVKEACETAQALGVQHLILWHTEDQDIPHRKQRYTEEGKPYFSGELLVPNDREILSL